MKKPKINGRKIKLALLGLGFSIAGLIVSEKKDDIAMEEACEKAVNKYMAEKEEKENG